MYFINYFIHLHMTHLYKIHKFCQPTYFLFLIEKLSWDLTQVSLYLFWIRVWCYYSPLLCIKGLIPCHYWVLSRHNLQWLKQILSGFSQELMNWSWIYFKGNGYLNVWFTLSIKEVWTARMYKVWGPSLLRRCTWTLRECPTHGGAWPWESLCWRRPPQTRWWSGKTEELAAQESWSGAEYSN